VNEPLQYIYAGILPFHGAKLRRGQSLLHVARSVRGHLGHGPQFKGRKNSVKISKAYQAHFPGGTEWALGLKKQAAEKSWIEFTRRTASMCVPMVRGVA